MSVVVRNRDYDPRYPALVQRITFDMTFLSLFDVTKTFDVKWFIPETGWGMGTLITVAADTEGHVSFNELAQNMGMELGQTYSTLFQIWDYDTGVLLEEQLDSNYFTVVEEPSVVNAIKNYGFETGNLTNWVTFGDGWWGVESLNSLEGNYYAVMGSYQSEQSEKLVQDVSLPQSSFWNFRVFFKNDFNENPEGTLWFDLTFTDSAGSVIHIEHVEYNIANLTPFRWYVFGKHFNLPEIADHVFVESGISSYEAAIWFDEYWLGTKYVPTLFKVTDSETGRGIRGALVQVGTAVGRTTDTGTAEEVGFCVVHIPGPGTYTCQVLHPSYHTDTSTLFVDWDTKEVNIQLTPATANISATVEVTDYDTGDPIPGADITAGNTQGTTDSAGRATLTFPSPGIYSYSLVHPQYQARTGSVDIVDGQTYHLWMIRKQVVTEGQAVLNNVNYPSSATTGDTVNIDFYLGNEGQEDDIFCELVDNDTGSVLGSDDYHMTAGDVRFVVLSTTMPARDLHIILRAGHIE